MIYLDFTATTPIAPDVLAEMHAFLGTDFGNSSSPHAMGVHAASVVERARETLLQAAGLADTHRCVFTSGGSEGNSQVFQSLLAAENRTGSVILSAVEHNSIRAFKEPLIRTGFGVSDAVPGPDGSLSPETVAGLVDDSTRLVSVMAVNNETGFIFDVAEIARAVRQQSARTRIHTDWVQGFVKLPADMKAVDYITVSAHKIFGPKGTGALFVRKNLPMPPMIGGSHEGGERGGTHNVAGIAGFAAAVKRSAGREAEKMEQAAKLRKRFIDRLAGKLDGFTVVDGVKQSPYILGLLVDKIKSEVVVRMLSDKGVYISAGSACATREAVQNHTALALGFDPDNYLRVSIHPIVPQEDLDAGADAIAECCNEFRTLMG